MKRKLLIMFICFSKLASAQDSLIAQSNITLEYLPVYKDSLGINKIGEIPQKSPLFLLKPGGQFTFFAYGNSTLGYVSKVHLDFNKYVVRGLNYNNLDWKIKEAKRLEDIYNRNVDSIARQDSVRRRLEAIASLNKGLRDGIHVVDFTLIDEDYKVGFSVTVSNYFKKTIKYIYFTIAGFNDVKDVEATKIFKGVGPISFISAGTYSFEDAFYSKVITSLKITKISIEFTDGSKKNLIGPELKRTLVYDD